MDWAKTTARGYKKHLSFRIWCDLYCYNNPSSVFGRHRLHDDVMTWERLHHYWSILRGIHRSSVDSPHNEPVMQGFDDFIVVLWRSCWPNGHVVGDLRRYYAHMTSMSLLCRGWKHRPHPFQIAIGVISRLKWRDEPISRLHSTCNWLTHYLVN